MARGGDAFGHGRIDVDSRLAAAFGIDRAAAGLGQGGCWQPAFEPRLDRRLDRIGGKVADNDERGLGGHIAALPVALQALRRCRIECLRRADRQTLGIKRAGVEEGDLRFEIAHLPAVAVAQFRQHHAALARHGLGIEFKLARCLAHQHQRSAQQRGIVARQVEHIGGLLEIGLGIGIGTEGQPFSLKQAHHFALGDIGRAVERHMFDEMGKAALIVRLVERTGGDLHAHGGSALGRRILADDIAHAIGQATEPVGGIDGNVAGLEGPDRLFARRRGRGNALQLRSAGRKREDGEEKRDQAAHWRHRGGKLSLGQGLRAVLRQAQHEQASRFAQNPLILSLSKDVELISKFTSPAISGASTDPALRSSRRLPAASQAAGRLPDRLRTRRPYPGGSGPCRVFRRWSCPTGGSRPG